jgi:hypothetical protein
VGGDSITLVLALMNEVSETIPGMILIKNDSIPNQNI